MILGIKPGPCVWEASTLPLSYIASLDLLVFSLKLTFIFDFHGENAFYFCFVRYRFTTLIFSFSFSLFFLFKRQSKYHRPEMVIFLKNN